MIDDNHLTKKLEKCIKETLGLECKRKIFAGNEGIFLARIINKLYTEKYQDTQYTAENIYELLTISEGLNRLVPKSNEKKTFRQIIRNIIYNRININSLKNKQKLDIKLCNNKVIHFAAHLREAEFVTRNISLSYNPRKSVNYKARKLLFKKLLESGIEYEKSNFIASIFPISHIEQYEYWSNVAEEIKVNEIATSIYGIMIDPAASAISRLDSTYTTYVQHGGGYGLYENPIHTIEKTGCNRMLWWGTGEENIYPTRYKPPEKIESNNKIIILLSLDSTKDDQEKWAKLRESIKLFTKRDVEIVGHPRGKVYIKNITSGINKKDLANADIVVCDSIFHTALFERIILNKPILCTDCPASIVPQHSSAKQLVETLRRESILVPFQEIEYTINLVLPENSLETYAPSLMQYMRNLPTLDELFGFTKIGVGYRGRTH